MTATEEMVPLLHSVISLTGLMTGKGLILIVNEEGVPTHVLPPLTIEGVTVIVEVTGFEVELVATKAGILPEPLPASPIEVLLFVQL